MGLLGLLLSGIGSRFSVRLCEGRDDPEHRIAFGCWSAPGAYQPPVSDAAAHRGR